MKLYVAAKYEERQQAQDLMQLFRTYGHTITHDWTQVSQLCPEQATQDWLGVKHADALIVLAERDLPYCGTLVEIGLALAWQIPVYIIGHALDHCIFLQLPEVRRYERNGHPLSLHPPETDAP